MSPSPLHDPRLFGLNRRDDALRTTVDDGLHGLHRHPSKAADADPGDRSANEERAKRRDASARDEHLAPPTATELITVAPRGELRAQRLTDADELCPVAQLGEPNVLRRHPAPRVPIEALGVFDRLPSLLERRQVPAFALSAHDPKPALRRVERQTAPDRKRLERLVGAERLVAEETS